MKVRFLKNHVNWKTGDIANIDDSMAAYMLHCGVVESADTDHEKTEIILLNHLEEATANDNTTGFSTENSQPVIDNPENTQLNPAPATQTNIEPPATIEPPAKIEGNKNPVPVQKKITKPKPKK